MVGDSTDAATLASTGTLRRAGQPGASQPGRSSDDTHEASSRADAQRASHFTVSRSATESSPLVRVHGALTGRTAPLLAAALDPLTRLGAGSGDVRVILTAVTEMTVAGAAPLLRAERRLRHAGGRLVLSQPSPIALALLSTTKLARHFRIDPPG